MKRLSRFFQTLMTIIRAELERQKYYAMCDAAGFRRLDAYDALQRCESPADAFATLALEQRTEKLYPRVRLRKVGLLWTVVRVDITHKGPHHSTTGITSFDFEEALDMAFAYTGA